MTKRSLMRLRHFLLDTDGTTSVEYAALLMLILAAVITAIQWVGGVNGGSWQDSADKITNATNQGS